MTSNKLSSEEKAMLIKLQYLEKEGFIKTFEYQPKEFVLFEGVKKSMYKIDKKTGKKKYSKRSFFINPHIYTADFKVIWNDNAIGKYIQDVKENDLSLDIPFYVNKIKDEYISWIEIKGSYDPYNTHRMARTYIVPTVWQNYKIYVQIIIPKKLILE